MMTYQSRNRRVSHLIKLCEDKGLKVDEIDAHFVGDEIFTHMEMQIQEASDCTALSFDPSSGHIEKLIGIAESIDCYVMPIIEAGVTADGDGEATYLYFVSRKYLDLVTESLKAFKQILATNYWLIQRHDRALEVRDDLVEMFRSVEIIRRIGEDIHRDGQKDSDVIRFNLDIVERLDGLHMEIREVDKKMENYPEFEKESFKDFLEK